MPYVRGYEPEPEPEAPKVSLVGFLKRNGEVRLIATRYGRRFTRTIKRDGLASFMEAAATIERKDPKTGEWRPVPRLTVYRWAKDGKLTLVRTREPGVSRNVLKIRILELRALLQAQGGLRLRPDDEAPAR